MLVDNVIKVSFSAGTGISNRIFRSLPKVSSQSAAKPSPFKGMYACRMTCLECGYRLPVRFEYFESINLTLHGQSFPGLTLHRLLKRLTSSELVHSESCPRCLVNRMGRSTTSSLESSATSSSSCIRRTLIAKVPKCLCIQLQRTYYNSTGTTYKNNVYVRFPETLDVRSYKYWISDDRPCSTLPSVVPSATAKHLSRDEGYGCFSHSLLSSNEESADMRFLYSLKAVVNHYGAPDSGHFINYVRRSDDLHRWWYLSDEFVKPASRTEVLSSTPYLLFYEKCCGKDLAPKE